MNGADLRQKKQIERDTEAVGVRSSYRHNPPLAADYAQLLNNAPVTSTIIQGDAQQLLRQLPFCSVNCCVTSPPYWMQRNYGVDGQVGLEASLNDYITKLVGVFREVKRVLRDDGTAWIVISDTYARPTKGATTINRHTRNMGNHASALGIKVHMDLAASRLKRKDLVGVPWRIAFALQNDGWFLRSDTIWHKLRVMPQGIYDRPTTSHEYVFLLAKRDKYYYDAAAIREPAKSQRETGLQFRNCRDVWTITPKPVPGPHRATFPMELAKRCILASCPQGGVVLDPFLGSGTTLIAANQNGRSGIGIELNGQYVRFAKRRIRDTAKGPLKSGIWVASSILTSEFSKVGE
jgi:site-specific DNA-methyltransferase (cytosine-N4-specific)